MAGRDVVLQVRITAAGLEAIDRQRGSWSRSEFVREALARAVKQQVVGPPVLKPAAEF